MRSQRLIRNRVRRKSQAVADVDITSLLDILVIMIVFLLMSYSSSGLVFDVKDGIKLPRSASITSNSAGLIVQVSPTTIIVDDIVVLDTKNQPPRIFDQNNKRILPLYDALVSKREEVKLIKASVKDEKPFSGIINFVIDKSLGYNYIKKLMYTAGEAGYFQFNFVVLGEET